MSPLAYLLCNIAYLVAGFVLGRLTRTVDQLAARKLSADVPKGAAVERKRPRMRLRFEHYVAIFLVLLGIFTAVQSLRQDAQTRRNAECTRDYADFFADALDARSKSSGSAQDANDELWSTIGKLMTGGQQGPEARAKFQAALDDFLSKRAAAKEQQQRNPYPPAPRDLCR